MAHKLISGYSGNHLVLNYAQTALVSMESPCPYAQWDYAVSNTGDVAVTAGSGFMRATATGTGSFTGVGVFQMLYTGANTLNFTLTKSGSANVGSVNIRLTVDGANVDPLLSLATNGTYTGTLSVPYYRYHIQVTFYKVGTWAAGDYANLAITLS